jgi:apolipoprotein N-acyltransferase
MIGKIALLALLAYTGGLHWIYISLHRFGELPSWLAALSTLLLAAYVALYAVGAAVIIRWMVLPFRHALTPWIVAGVVTLMEWLRGSLFTGFPWLSTGYLVIDTPLAGFAPLVGVYGVGFTAALCLTWLAQALFARLIFPFVLTVVMVGAGSALQLHDWTTPQGKPLSVALVQGAIPQSMKFDPRREADAISTQLGLANTAAAPQGPQLIVLPETALVRPWQHISAETRAAFSQLAQRSGASVILGVPLQDADGYRNSAVLIHAETPAGDYAGRYDKHHLVPFGEFIPWGFRWFVNMMNMPLGDFQRGAPVQLPFVIADQRVSPNICFEDLFGEELIRVLSPDIPRNEQPTILLNLSNLAWFGDTIALSQHLAISRMRAIETGRPMIRATNTGATAAIDGRGRVIGRLPFGQEGLLVTQVQGLQGQTPFVHFGNLPVVIFSLLLVVIGIVWRPGKRSAVKLPNRGQRRGR